MQQQQREVVWQGGWGGGGGARKQFLLMVLHKTIYMSNTRSILSIQIENGTMEVILGRIIWWWEGWLGGNYKKCDDHTDFCSNCSFSLEAVVIT
jgi:hypothetical protein